MEYMESPNIALEALVYLGARANGFDARRLEARLQSKGCIDLITFRQRYAPFQRLREQLDSLVTLPDRQLERFFCDLPGLPYNTTGAFSIASLLLFPGICRYDGDLDQVLHEIAHRSADQLAQDMLGSLGISDAVEMHSGNGTEAFLKSVLSLTIPAESRLALLEAHQNYRELLWEIGDCLRPVIAALEDLRPELLALSQAFGAELMETGCEPYLREISSLHIAKGVEYRIHPLLLGPDTNLSLDDPLEDGSVVVYCGVLRLFLKELISTIEGATTQVYEAIKLLGDRTRFDILCFLKDRPAYGQELSEHFGLVRNTIYHHLNKLLNAGLVTCTVEGTRVYYAIDREHLENLLDQQRALLLGDPPANH